MDSQGTLLGFEGLVKDDIKGKLVDQYIVPPFSILDTRQGYWQDRKRMWLSLGIKGEIGRGSQLTCEGDVVSTGEALSIKSQNSLNAIMRGNKDLADGYETGTSIFDPVLCELCYKWFCPQNGKVLDVFAGGVCQRHCC